MLDRSIVERLRHLPQGEGYVVSVYLGHGPDIDELRTMPTKLKAALAEVRVAAEAVEGASGRALRRDLDTVQAMASELGADLGRGSALFVSSEVDLREHVMLPAPVRDRVIVDTTPYLGPLQSMLDHYHRYAAVLVDRRGAMVYRFHLGELQSWEQMAADEPIRKDNYGGFGGYEEHRVRGHAEEVARRLFRTIAERLADLSRTAAFDLLVIGGSPVNAAALIQELAPDVSARLAGTFTIDPHTATPADVRTACRGVAAEYDRTIDAELVDDLLGTAGAGGRAVLGIEACIEAANLGSVDRLLVAADHSEPGVGCPACGALGFTGDECATCGGATRPVADLVDGIADRVRATGGRVRYVIGDSALSGAVVGATVRYLTPG